MPKVISNVLDIFLPVVLTLNLLSDPEKEWNLVTNHSEMAYYVNHLSHAIVRTVMGIFFCILLRILLCRKLGPYFTTLSVITDIASYFISIKLPTSWIIASIVLLSYTMIGFRFMYDMIITGYGLRWILHLAKGIIDQYEVEEEINGVPNLSGTSRNDKTEKGHEKLFNQIIDNK